MQFKYSPRELENCGLTDGEATERLWSYLRRMAKITKEMRPSHRIDVLSSALIHYASKVSHNLGMFSELLSWNNFYAQKVYTYYLATYNYNYI